MAIKINGTTVVDNARQLQNIASLDATTATTFGGSITVNNRAVGTVTGNATLDLSTGTIFEYTPTEVATTFAFSNPPANGTGCSFDMAVTSAAISKSFDLSSAALAGDGIVSISAQTSSTQGIALNNDGTKLFVLSSSADAVFQYSLPTAYDVTNMSYDSVSFSIAAQDTAPSGIVFNNDGTKMYIVGYSSDSVYEYAMSSFDLTTASFNTSLTVAAQDATPRDIAFNNDGTRLYVVGDTGNTIYQYDLSTPYALSTAAYNSDSFNVATQATSPQSVRFNSDGTKMYVNDVQSSSAYIYQYSLSTPFDITTAVYDNVSSFWQQIIGYSVFQPYGFVFNNDGTRIIAVYNSYVGQYDLPTAYDASEVLIDYYKWQTSFRAPTAFAFNSDGTDLFILSANNAEIYKYDTHIAYDIRGLYGSTASFSVSAQTTDPRGLAFNNAGTKMYLVGTGATVWEYNLSTAFDITTATLSTSFSYSAESSYANGITFNPDGTKMFLMNGVDNVAMYNLSTAFDVSTASYSNVAFSIAGSVVDGLGWGLVFGASGTKMYVTGGQNDSVYEFDLSTAYDISTAAYNGVSLYLWTGGTGQTSAPQGIIFSPDGAKMIIGGNNNPSSVWQYSTGFSGATPTFSYPDSVKWPGGTSPTPPAVGQTDLLQFLTVDGGTTYLGRVLGDNFS